MIVVQSIQRWREQGGPSCRRLLAAAGLPRSSFLRWQRRIRRGRPAIQTATARDVPALEKKSPAKAVEIRTKIAALSHGRRRTRGAPALFQIVKTWLSRRSFQILVRARRQEIAREREAACTRIEWSRPAAVWAMDPGQLGTRHWNLVGDLASRFRFELVTATMLPAHTIANQLESLFARHGAPLVLKRDNGSNLAGGEVDELLDAYGVIALNSPPHYPAYNGAIEYAQRELKARIERLTAQGLALDDALAQAPVLLNATPRPCLNDQTAAEVFYPARDDFQRQFTLNRRKEIHDLIQDEASCIRVRMERCGHPAQGAAWRRAVEQWLEENGLMTVRQPQIVLPHYPRNWPHLTLPLQIRSVSDGSTRKAM